MIMDWGSERGLGKWTGQHEHGLGIMNMDWGNEHGLGNKNVNWAT